MLPNSDPSAPSSAPSIRADLIHRRVCMGNQPVWVVKDPLSREFFYFSDQEHEILNFANGQRSFSQINGECVRKFAPQYISAESLVRFFAQARKNGLLVIDGSGMPNRDSTDDSRGRWWRNPIAIRMPGWNPDRFLDSILPYAKPLFSPTALVIVLLLMFVSAVIVTQDFASLAEHVSIAASRFGSGRSFVILLLVISLTKVVHELAHALACKRFGGECRELGVMLLVGVPCLYCDVSDAWLLQQRWKRILVSAAGMLAELTLAAIATILWMFTVDGLARDLCVTVMVVCSVTTVLFNGNPLLRYDGYYILSDLVGIPNLSGQSTAMIRGWFRRLLWATPPPQTGLSASRHDAFVVGYGVVSGLYRILVYAFILLILYRVADRYEFGGVVGAAILLAAAWFVYQGVKSILTPPDRSVRRASMSSRRPALILGALAIAGFLGVVIPIPRSVVAPMSIQPAGAQSIFVTSEGVITDGLRNGAEVVQGQSIAALRNSQVDQKLLAIRALCERLSVELDALRQRRGTDREASSRIPLVEKRLAEATKQKRLYENVAAQLILKSPRNGRVFAPPSQTRKTTDDRQPQFWTGTPLEAMNRGAWLGEGTLLCVVGDTTAREAILLMRQQDIELVEANQSVALLLSDQNRGAVIGTVMEVSATPTRERPIELDRDGLIEPTTRASMETPQYQVRVSLDPTPVALPVRLTGHARISVSSASILTRVGRFLRDSFG